MEKLNSFVEYHEKRCNELGIAQGNANWHAARRLRIGGSQISTLIGYNPYETLYSLIKKKIKPETIIDIKMMWGNVFERMIREYIAESYKINIMGNDIYITKDDCVSYSPDGLAMHPDGDCILLEFKCPYTRLPSLDVPAYYKPQVYYGLDVIDICSYGLFCEGVFRLCSLSQLNHPTSYNSHVGGYVSTRNAPCVARGFIVVYRESGVDVNPELEDNMVDYGTTENDKEIAELFEKVVHRKTVKLTYSKIFYTTITDDDIAELMTDDVVGIIPWKLLRIKCHKLNRVTGFLDAHLPKIKMVTSIIKDAEGLPDGEIDKFIKSRLAADKI